jgi:hypothetical protein
MSSVQEPGLEGATHHGGGWAAGAPLALITDQEVHLVINPAKATLRG